MKKFVTAFSVACALTVFSACTTEEPSVVAGRDWNAGAQVVADTTSQFNLEDPMLLQFNYGKKFDFTKLKITFFEGTLASKGKELWSREVAVTTKMDSYTLKATDKKGFAMSARDLTHLKGPGSVVVEFGIEGKSIVSKEITLVSSGRSAGNPTIIAGRDINPGDQSVKDTTSKFGMEEPMVVQFNYGKKFDFDKLKIAFYEGSSASKSKELWSHVVPVNSKMDSYTQVSKSKRGFLNSAKEVTHSKGAGSVLIEFSADGKVLATKNIKLVPGK